MGISKYLLFFAACASFAQVTGLPTNMDEHPGMDMPSNVDRPTSHVKHGAPPAPQASARAVAQQVLLPQTLVSTRSYDNVRSGANLNETVLTLGNASGLRKLYSHTLPGDARGLEAAPLVVPNVKLADGRTRDLVVYATMSNYVQACDARSKQCFWGQQYGTPIKGNGGIDGWGINDYWGILSTPVVDPEASMLYAVSWQSPDNTGDWTTAIHKVLAIDLRDGHLVKSLSLENVQVDPGHGLPVQKFSGSERKQRGSLGFAEVDGHKTVFIPFGTIKETSGASRGWLLAYDVASNAVQSAWVAAARYSGGGIWAAGQGPVLTTRDNWQTADLFFETGNGSFDAVTEWGECVMHLQFTPNGGFKVADWWSPFSDSGRAGGPQDGTHITKNVGLGWDDMDLGSAGVTLLPFALIASGKDGIAYSLNPWNLGRTAPSDFVNPEVNYRKAKWIGYFTYPSAMDVAQYGPPPTPTPDTFSDLNRIYPQGLTNKNNPQGPKGMGLTHHVHGSPVWFKDQLGDYKIYVWGENGNLRCFEARKDGTLQFLANGAEQASPNSPRPPGGMPGGMLSISANGSKDVILWAAVPDGDANKQITTGHVYAYDANNLGRYSDGTGSIKLLWTSPVYTYDKFDVVVVSGGKVYVPTYSGSVDVYGL